MTVDPKYTHYLAMLYFLEKLDVVELEQVKHSISMAAMIGGRAPQPKPHWIEMAIVSLSRDFIELKAK